MTDEPLVSRITHMDIDDLLDNVPKITKADLKKNSGKRGRKMIPVETCLSVFLEWQKGRRLVRSERQAAGLLSAQIAERYGICHLSVSKIGNRKMHWERIKPRVAEMVALGQAQFLLEPMYKR